ncbi:Uncharacterised protein [Staphylococcus microti]|uniref:Uncharacterized protein n=1 Tax=Staphylococcus microti TaxID=569857 RepID=A0A380GW63_9STAP|nr:Uncharacterised protein [Staphylococcus microti]
MEAIFNFLGSIFSSIASALWKRNEESEDEKQLK